MSIPYVSGEALTCQQLRELDVLAIEHVGVPGLVLMENAARTAAEFVYSTLLNPTADRVLVMCGPGNNGGDGLVIARHLHNAGVPVVVALSHAREAVRGDAAVNLGVFSRMDGVILCAAEASEGDAIGEAFWESEVVVDALLGTGATGAPRDDVAAFIQSANANQHVRRVAIDIPSGLDADTGRVFDPCFQADATVTFVAEKVGFRRPAARAVLGRVVVADIGVPRKLIPGRK